MLPSMHTAQLGAQDIQRIFGAMHLQTMAMLQEILSGVHQANADRASYQDSATKATSSEESRDIQPFQAGESARDDLLPEPAIDQVKEFRASDAVTMRVNAFDGSMSVIWKSRARSITLARLNWIEGRRQVRTRSLEECHAGP
jgi:hypothetical protein